MVHLLVNLLIWITLSVHRIFAQNGPYFSHIDPYSSSLYASSFMIPPPGAVTSGEQYAYTEVKTPLYHYYFFSPVLKPANLQPEMFIPTTEKQTPVIDYKSGFGLQYPKGLFTPNSYEDGNTVTIPNVMISNPSLGNNLNSPPLSTRRPPITSLYAKNKPLFQPASTPLYSTPNVIRSEESAYSTQNPREVANAPSYKVYVLKKRPLTRPEDIPEVMAAPPTNIVREDDEEENLPPTFAKEKSSTESFPTAGTSKLNDYPTVFPPVFIYQREPIVPANLLPSEPALDLPSLDPSLYIDPKISDSDEISSEETKISEDPGKVLVYSVPKLRPYPTVSTEELRPYPTVSTEGMDSSSTNQTPVAPAMLLPSEASSDLESFDPARSIFSFPTLTPTPQVYTVKSPNNSTSKDRSKSTEQTFKPTIVFEAPGHNTPS